MLHSILAAVLDGLNYWIKPFFTSTLIAAIAPSLAGALAGAWIAKRIAERSKLREELLKEIRNTNAASAMLYGIANTHIAMKRQHIKRLKDAFIEEKERLDLFLQAKRAGTVPPQQSYNFSADLQKLKPHHSPIERVQQIIFDQLSPSAAVLFTTPVLVGASQQLNETLEERNALIESWNTNPPKDFIAEYFGLPQGSRVDERYKSTIMAISALNDDVIAFSTMIADELHEHAIEQRTRFKRKFRRDVPNVNKFDFRGVSDLLPDQDQYKDFAKLFKRKSDIKLTPIERVVSIFTRATAKRGE